jgi:hydrogenase expression/formation protein HypE
MMGRLIKEHILAALGNQTLNELTDGAVLACPTSRIVFTTDSFVVQPLEFPGGDIGRLAVCGTVNDLAVMGGRPIGLSLGLIVEEGFELAALDRILASIAQAARQAGVCVVTGDTKVIERHSGGNLLINTAGVGLLDERVRLNFEHIRAGDAVLISGAIGDHGMAVMSARNGLEFQTPIASDAAPLNGMIQELLTACPGVRFMRDPTRGGLAGVLAEIAERTGLGLEIHEDRIPCHRATRAAAEMLGFDVLSVANEGKVVIVAPAAEAEGAVATLRGHPLGKHAACIGRLVEGDPPLVELHTASGGQRLVQQPYGEELPRIC